VAISRESDQREDESEGTERDWLRLAWIGGSLFKKKKKEIL